MIMKCRICVAYVAGGFGKVFGGLLWSGKRVAKPRENVDHNNNKTLSSQYCITDLLIDRRYRN